MLVETIIQIKVKPLFMSNLLVLETIFYGFFRYSCPWKQLFHVVETYFLKNPSFWLVESEFQSIGNNILLFTAFFLLVETIISSKLRFH